jgi:EAL domain-containing protein (putative c-di-GMP-specific phosphodiesterase class I)/ActR/RegA family two-component response regulator
MKIMLLDDDSFALKVLARQLTLLGCSSIISIQRTEEAYFVMSKEGHDIDLIFCDLQMPDIDGIEFIRHLANIDWRGSLALVSGEDPRILQTAERLAKAHGISLVGALSKPVNPSLLRDVLAKHEAPTPLSKTNLPMLRLPDELAKAIDAGELINHYQPKVSLATGQLIGVEALVRWQHPHDGLIYPDQFISVAEEHGLIDRLAYGVLQRAMQQLRRWKTMGLHVHMAVNISMENLATLEFPDKVAEIMAGAGIAPEELVLEVTESRLMKDMVTPLDILTRLRLKRISLAIDDFGTGHSSLVQLRDLPFEELKLDKGFVSNAVKDSALAAIVDGALGMARQLGITSVAEGVESRADWDFLVARGCGVAQGYFISRPMAGEDMLGWAASWGVRSRALKIVGAHA